MARIKDIAQICKSKNAGPFNVTVDVLFEDHEVYRAVKATGVLTPALFSTLYGVDGEQFFGDFRADKVDILSYQG